MKNIAIVDAGPLIALFNQSDLFHQKAKNRIKAFREKARGRLFTTWPVISEATYLLRDRVGLEAQLDFLSWIEMRGLELFPLEPVHLGEIGALQQKYRSLPMDFADATLVVAAQNLKTNQIFSIDGDFTIYRLAKKLHFTNLMD